MVKKKSVNLTGSYHANFTRSSSHSLKEKKNTVKVSATDRPTRGQTLTTTHAHETFHRNKKANDKKITVHTKNVKWSYITSQENKISVIQYMQLKNKHNTRKKIPQICLHPEQKCPRQPVKEGRCDYSLNLLFHAFLCSNDTTCHHTIADLLKLFPSRPHSGVPEFESTKTEHNINNMSLINHANQGFEPGPILQEVEEEVEKTSEA